MRIEDFEREYQIREFQVKSQRLQTELSWKFKSASHFWYSYDSRYEFDIESRREAGRRGITDKEIATGKSEDQPVSQRKWKVPVILCPGEGVCAGQKDHDPSGTENEKGNSL